MLVNGVSIIICCHNSGLLLDKTLEHIANQNLNGLNCEVILVDNASTDNTSLKAQEIWNRIGSPNIQFNIIYEAKAGLMNARKKGTYNANYEYLIFCDDDNWLDENYINNTVILFSQNPQVVVLGGMGIAQIENENLKPIWFNKFYQSYAISNQSESECLVNGVYGAGMAIRKSILTKIFNDRPMFLHGRKSNQLTAGEDGEICCRVRLAGYNILFSPQLTFKHFLPKNRLTWVYLKKLHIGFAKSYLVINLYESILNNENLKPFYWLKQTLYFGGIYLKYWPGYYFNITKDDLETKEIHLLTWKNIALTYIRYNFKTIKMYNEINGLKNLLNTDEFY